MPAFRTIGQAWAVFDASCVPAAASDGQVLAMQQSFYSGAAAVLAMVHAVALEEGLTLDQRAERLGELGKEVNAFADMLLGGRAKRRRRGPPQ